MYKSLFVSILAVAAIATSAQAADMLVKAPASNLLAFPYNGSGPYWGFASKGGVEQDSASGTFLASSLATGNANALGGSLGLTFGYMRSMGVNASGSAQAVAFEGNGYWSNVTASAPAVGANGTVAPASFATRWSADQVVKVYGFNPLALIGNLGFGGFPTLPTAPTIPGITILPNGHPYLMAGIEEWGFNAGFAGASSNGVGIAALVGAGVMNQIVDTTGKLTGGVLDVGAQVVFADKGVGITGFGAGAPVFGSLTSGRKYEVFGKILF
jgi:hypothetical protein